MRRQLAGGILLDDDLLDGVFRERGQILPDLLRATGPCVGLRLAERQRQRPIRTQRIVVGERTAFDGDMIVENGQQHAMLVIAADKRMLDGAWSEVVGVYATGPMADVAQRRRADGREAVLPDARFVAQRIVGMAREDNRVRQFRERLRGGAVVVAPHPRPMACALRMRMLRIEERQLRIDFRLVRRHEFADLAMMRPMAADERVAFDVLHHDFLPLFMETGVP